MNTQPKLPTNNFENTGKETYDRLDSSSSSSKASSRARGCSSHTEKNLQGFFQVWLQDVDVHLVMKIVYPTLWWPLLVFAHAPGGCSCSVFSIPVGQSKSIQIAGTAEQNCAIYSCYLSVSDWPLESH